MSKLKRFIAAAAAATMTLSLAGCTDTSYVISEGDDKVNAGVYIYNMLTEMSYQMTIMYYMDGVTDDYFSQQVDGVDFADYLSDYALTSTKEYAAVVKQFEELGLELTEDELKEINDTVSSTWESQGDFLESEGISKDSVKLVTKAATMRSRLFDYFYAQGGTEEVTDSDIETYLNENYIRYKTITIYKSAEEDETAATAENEENLALRDEFLDKAQGVSFEDFDTVIDEYNAYLEELEAEEAAEEEAAEDTSSDAEDDTSSDEDSDVSDDTSSDTDSEDSESADDSAADSETSEVSDDSTADSDVSDEVSDVIEEEESIDGSETEEETEEEEDPYVNEAMFNYGGMDDETKESNTGLLAEEINGLEVGVATAYEDDIAYYIVIKGDVTERSAEYAAENHDTLVQEMKSDEFQEKVTSWVEAMDIKENSDAIKRYTPKVVYDKQDEYYAANS